MRIYTKIVINMATLLTISQVSYEYTGPVALACGGDGGGGDGGGDIGAAPGSSGISSAFGGDASPGGLSGGSGGSGGGPSMGGSGGAAPGSSGISSAFGGDASPEGLSGESDPSGGPSDAAINSMVQNRAAMIKSAYTVVDNLVSKATFGIGKGLVSISNEEATAMAEQGVMDGLRGGDTNASLEANLDEMGPEEREAFTRIMNSPAFKTSEQQIMSLAQMDTSQMSARDLAMFDEIQRSQIEVFTNTINERVLEISNSEISRLVDRGVLTGDVGATALAKIRESALDAISKGTTEITTERMRNELAFRESGREMEWRSGEAALDRYNSQQIEESRNDAIDKANKWNLFGNIGAGIIDVTGDDDDSSWGWEDLF